MEKAQHNETNTVEYYCDGCGQPLPVVIGHDGEERYDAAIAGAGGEIYCRRCLGEEVASELLLPK